jgi:hypothetical protein
LISVQPAVNREVAPAAISGWSRSRTFCRLPALRPQGGGAGDPLRTETLETEIVIAVRAHFVVIPEPSRAVTAARILITT